MVGETCIGIFRGRSRKMLVNAAVRCATEAFEFGLKDVRITGVDIKDVCGWPKEEVMH
jgi:hypothetical protein